VIDGEGGNSEEAVGGGEKIGEKGGN